MSLTTGASARGNGKRMVNHSLGVTFACAVAKVTCQRIADEDHIDPPRFEQARHGRIVGRSMAIFRACFF